MKTNTACIGFHYLYYSAGADSDVPVTGVCICTVIFVVSAGALLARIAAGKPYTTNRTTATATIIMSRRNPNHEPSLFPGVFTIVAIRY